MKYSKLLSTLTVFAVAAGIMVAIAAPSRAAERVSPTMSPPANQTAIKNGDTVTFGGSVAPGATLSEAFVVTLDGGGAALKQTDVTDRVSFTNDQITGTRTLVGFTNEAAAIRFVVVADFPDGSRDSGQSATLPVDVERPVITAYELVGEQRVRVQFSEPVHLPGSLDENNRLDWKVDPDANGCNEGAPCVYPVEVQGSAGDTTRILVLAAPQPTRNSTPEARYSPERLSESYRDRADHHLGVDNRFSISIDKLPPLPPQIAAIAGDSSRPYIGRESAPTVRVSGMCGSCGDVAEVYLEADGKPGRTDGDPLVGSAAANANTVDVTTQDLGADGEYVYYAVATDAPGNRSDRGHDTEPADAATYRLDTIVPAPLHAKANGAESPQVQVTFSEPIWGGRRTADWTVINADNTPAPVTGVTGNDGTDVRNLQTSAPVFPGARVAWIGNDIADEVGNRAATFELAALDNIPPVIRVTRPAVRAWANTGTYELRGTVTADTVRVEAYRSDAAGVVTGDAVAQGPTTGTTFSLAVPLLDDASNYFVVKAIDADDNVGQTRTAEIVHDDTAPSLSFAANGSPNEGQALPGGINYTIRYAAADANFGLGPVSIELSKDGGASWTPLARAQRAGNGSFVWQIPMQSIERARLRLLAVDRATNQAPPVVSPQFAIDAVAPRFGSSTLDATGVTVTFTEPVSGSLNPLDWSIDVTPGNGVDDPVQFTGMDSARYAHGNAVTSFVLRRNDLTPTIAANAEPIVYYCRPKCQDTSIVLNDRAGNVVPVLERTVAAVDAIAPLTPSVGDHPELVDAVAVALLGEAQSHAGNRVIARRKQPSTMVESAQVRQDGTFEAELPLVRNARNVFEVRVQDPSGNVSPAVDLVIAEDSRAPRVRVVRPPSRVRSGRSTLVRWRTSDHNKDWIQIRYQIKGRRGARLIARRTADDGRETWRIPRMLRRKLVRTIVIAHDRLHPEQGHRTVARSPWFKVR